MAGGGIFPQSRNGNYHRAANNNQKKKKKNQTNIRRFYFLFSDPSATFSGVDMNANANRKPAFPFIFIFWHKINVNFQF